MRNRHRHAAIDPNHPEHHDHHLIEKTEGGMDYLMLAIIVALGLAMAVGPFTATGDASWLR